MTRDAAHRKALRVFGKRAFSSVQNEGYEYPPPVYSVGTSYVRDGGVHLVVKGEGGSWASAFKAAAHALNGK